MRIGVLGSNHKSSDLHLRELLSKACEKRLRSESPEAAALSVVLLSTCNRTEIYFSAPDLPEAHGRLLHLLREEISSPFEHQLYSYFGGDCFAHLAEVITGFDSALAFETEIQKQVKVAYAMATCDHALSSPMHFLFQKSLKIGKKIRSTFPLPPGTPGLEALLFYFCRDLKDFSLFFVGNSEINRKILSFFKNRGEHRMTLCTRGVLSAQEVATRYGVEIVDWSAMPSWQEHDVVICGSNYPEYLISPKQLHPDRSFKTRFIFDLSLPRTVDPKLGRHPTIHLRNIEELSELVAVSRQHHLQGMYEAEQLLSACVDQQLSLYNARETCAQNHYN